MLIRMPSSFFFFVPQDFSTQHVIQEHPARCDNEMLGRWAAVLPQGNQAKLRMFAQPIQRGQFALNRGRPGACLLYICILLSEPVPSETNVNKARHRGDELVLLCLAGALGVLQRGRFTVVDVGPVGLHHWRLSCEEQLSRRHACGAEALPDHRPGVIARIAVEVTAVPVLARLSMHGYPGVDVVALSWLHPPVDLDHDSFWSAVVYLDVHDVERFAAATLLHHCALAIVLEIGNAREAEARGEATEDGLPVAGRRVRRDEDLAALEEWPANGERLLHGEAARHPRGQIATLDPDLLALHNPILSWAVVIRMHVVEGHDVGVPPNSAGADGAGRGRRRDV